jgi:AbrB family looped-hinge helix DNA binding protein
MATTTVSDNLEIAIPEELRSRLNIRQGQQIELVPVGDIRDARGFLRGIRSTSIEREPDRL